ncbi:MAG: hypothetical protein R3B90_17715 [Planctomycetaceae bacterium]
MTRPIPDCWVLSANLTAVDYRGVDTTASSGGVIGLPTSQGLPAAFERRGRDRPRPHPELRAAAGTPGSPPFISPATARRQGNSPVFFRRSASEGGTLYDITSFQSNNFRIAVDDYTGGKPAVGDYIFGTWVQTIAGQLTHHGRWYRIQQVEDKGSDDYVITLDRRWVGRTAGEQPARVMFPRSVISVFDLPVMTTLFASHISDRDPHETYDDAFATPPSHRRPSPSRLGGAGIVMRSNLGVIVRLGARASRWWKCWWRQRLVLLILTIFAQVFRRSDGNDDDPAWHRPKRRPRPHARHPLSAATCEEQLSGSRGREDRLVLCQRCMGTPLSPQGQMTTTMPPPTRLRLYCRERYRQRHR